jgi:Na+-transporting methylmalonyl-CoA/oxaloacetate decarboxylase gamma subunit
MDEVLNQSFELMWKGMASIFVVIAAIFIVTLLVSRIKGKKEE